VLVAAKRGVTAYARRSLPCQRAISASHSSRARQRLAFVARALHVVAQAVGRMAIHQHLASDQAHAARTRGRE